MICSSNFGLFVISCLLLLQNLESSPITNPLKDDADIQRVIPDYIGRKSPKNYFNSTPHARKEVPIISYNSPDPDCNVGFKLAWSSGVASPVYATPIVFPSGNASIIKLFSIDIASILHVTFRFYINLGSDGKKQIILSTFHHNIEIIGHDGYKPPGWPLTFEDSTFQGSPMLYDIDGDGTNDVGVVDKNGNLFWIRIGDNGQYLENYHIQVPKLKIKRDWAAGLDPKFTDNYVMMSMFDHKSDRDSGRQYEYASGVDQPLFSSKEGALGKPGAIRPDDLGSLVIKQDSYPELNKIIDSSNMNKEAPKSSIHGRKLLSIDENEDGSETVKDDQSKKDPPMVNIPAVESEPEDYNVDNGDTHRMNIAEDSEHHKVDASLPLVVGAVVVPEVVASAAVVPEVVASAAVVPEVAASAAVVPGDASGGELARPEGEATDDYIRYVNVILRVTDSCML